VTYVVWIGALVFSDPGEKVPNRNIDRDELALGYHGSDYPSHKKGFGLFQFRILVNSSIAFGFTLQENRPGIQRLGEGR
jgi:hypothetical protein